MTSRIEYNNPVETGQLGLTYHYEMVSDRKRVVPFKKAIQKLCKGKRVLESGCGTGILSIIAARAGATRVYAIEIDSVVAKFARENVKKSGFQDIIKIISKDTKKVTLRDLDGEKVDVVIAENLSTWQVTEEQIAIMNEVNKKLVKPRGVRIPAVIFNTFELTHADFEFEGVIELRTHYFQFTGIREPKIHSKPVVVSEVKMNVQNATKIDKKVKVRVSKGGVLNSLRLTSPLEVGPGIRFAQSDSLMPPVIVPLKEDLKVKRGDVVEVRLHYKTHTHWHGFECSVRKVS